MRREHLVTIFTVFLVIPLLLGCGLKNVMPGKKVPLLDSYSSIVLVCAGAEKSSGEYGDLPTLLAYGIGTKLEVRHQDTEWIYDKSREVHEVSDKLKELNISARDVYMDPQTAVKLAEAFQADLVIAWQLTEDPRYTKEESGKITEEKSNVSVTGAARYYTIHQTAILKADTKMMTKTPEIIWDGRIIGYQKYATRYRTGNPPKSQREETMYSDVRKDFVQKFVDKVYPAKVAETG